MAILKEMERNILLRLSLKAASAFLEGVWVVQAVQCQ